MSTKIEWCDETWNPITGCTPISEGCKNCYAKRMANRLRGRFGYPDITPFYPTFHLDKVEQPIKWKKPRKIFVCSMGDLFHESYPEEWMTLVWAYVILGACKGHTMMILTKRPTIMKKFIEKHPMNLTHHKNIWLGVTTENQKTADERIPILLQIDAPVRFVSVEPMLGPVDLSRFIWPVCPSWPARYKSPKEAIENGAEVKYNKRSLVLAESQFLDWIICGGETGQKGRPINFQWVRKLRDQCKGAQLPFFFKKWKNWIFSPCGSPTDPYDPDKRTIDGKLHQEFPEVS